MSHLPEPLRRHPGPHAGVIDKHDARIADRDSLVGRLDELSAEGVPAGFTPQ
jgi:hypothetical protein